MSGIRTIEDLRDRCVVDDIAGCWLWRGAMQGRAQSLVPVAWWPAGRRILTVPRIAWMLRCGRQPIDGHMVWRVCRNDRCANPVHMRSGSRAAWGEWLAESGLLKNPAPTTSQRRARVIARGATVLTLELAQWARESEQTGRAVARALGVSEQTVTRIRKLQRWAPVTPNASVFAWAARAAA